MKRTLLFATVIATAWFVSTAFGETGNELFQKALVRERSEGNLKEAIKLYQQVVDKYGKDRALAAKALVAIGESQEKLGESEARKTYERIVREYGDQKQAVAMAHARLGANASSLNAGIVTRQVWTGPKVDVESTHAISPDGRYLSFVDWDTGDLALHDLTSGVDRRLTNKGSWSDSDEFAEESVIAPDGKKVAYSWFNKDGRYDLRLVTFGSTNAATPRILYSNEDIAWIAPFDWSADGKWIGVNIERMDQSVQVGLVDSGSGALRVLKSGEWSGAGTLAFSPDSRFLAFDRPPFDEPEQRDVFVLAVDGSREIPVVVHPAMDTLVSWSPDGKKLLFASDRTGSTGIWGVAVEDGKPQGAPELVKANTGGLFPLGLTRSGALYFGVRVGGPDVYLTSVDFNSGKVLSAPTPVAQQWVHANNQADWSSDGKYLALHITPASPGGQHKLIVQSMETGKTRELKPRLRYFQAARWSPDGTSFLVNGTDFKGRQGIYRMDAQNADIALLVPRNVNAGSTFPEWSPDGKRIYYFKQNSQGDEAILERDLASGTERELFHRKQVVRQSLSVSPDGRYLSFIGSDPAGKESALMIVPVTGGDARVLLTLPLGGRFTALSSDGRSLLFTKHTSPTGDDGSEVWTIPLAGGQPQKLDLGGGSIRGLRVQPGRNGLAFFRPTGGGNLEVWALENFLPASKASK